MARVEYRPPPLAAHAIALLRFQRIGTERADAAAVVRRLGPRVGHRPLQSVRKTTGNLCGQRVVMRPADARDVLEIAELGKRCARQDWIAEAGSRLVQRDEALQAVSLIPEVADFKSRAAVQFTLHVHEVLVDVRSPSL